MYDQLSPLFCAISSLDALSCWSAASILIADWSQCYRFRSNVDEPGMLRLLDDAPRIDAGHECDECDPLWFCTSLDIRDRDNTRHAFSVAQWCSRESNLLWKIKRETWAGFKLPAITHFEGCSTRPHRRASHTLSHSTSGPNQRNLHLKSMS